MYYFDGEYLKKYLNKHSDLQVFVDSDFYTITSEDDISNPEFGVGYDLSGQPHEFDYRFIEYIKIGDVTFTKEQLQKSLAGEEDASDEPKQDADTEEEPKTDDKSGGEEPAKDEKAPEDDIEKSYEEGTKTRLRVGQSVINEDIDDINYGTKGRVVYINEDMATYQFYSKRQLRVISVVKNVKYLQQI